MSGPADPFALGDGPDACLLLHGLTGSPAEVRPLGEALALAGLRAVGPLLPGHGTTPEDLLVVSRADMLRAAESAYLSLRGARRLYLCGLSMGALLAVHLAARSFIREGLPDLSALALLAPAVEFSGATWVFTQVMGRLPSLPFVIGKGGRDIRSQRAPLQIPDGSYRAVPLRWGAELRALSAQAQKLARRVHARTLILQGALDRTVAPSGARKLARELGATRVEVRILEWSGHVLPLDLEADEVCRSVVSFFKGTS